MKYTKTVKAIVENVGGKENISGAAHCMTRLRLNLYDSSKVKEDALKSWILQWASQQRPATPDYHWSRSQ